jgi:hypothetical protein
MDDQVVAAMSRWPDVPAVFGWLSLNRQGQWRIHPQGQGNSVSAGPPGEDTALDEGEAITNPQILQFINRNYCGDEQGRWYFQNGPQRVFVRLDAAAYILHTTGTNGALQTHNELPVQHVSGWWLDDEGKLYANTEHGPALVAGRDTMAVFEALHTSDGRALLEVLDPEPPKHPIMIAPLNADDESGAAPMHFCMAAQIPRHMGFTRFPAPDANELIIK